MHIFSRQWRVKQQNSSILSANLAYLALQPSLCSGGEDNEDETVLDTIIPGGNAQFSARAEYHSATRKLHKKWRH